jgi:hypothetical protein
MDLHLSGLAVFAPMAISLRSSWSAKADHPRVPLVRRMQARESSAFAADDEEKRADKLL